MQVSVRQSLNETGWLGAAMFVVAPVLSAYLWMRSTAEYAREVAIFGAGSSFVTANLYSPAVYVALSAVSLAGLVMVIVGRDFLADMPDTKQSDRG